MIPNQVIFVPKLNPSKRTALLHTRHTIHPQQVESCTVLMIFFSAIWVAKQA